MREAQVVIADSLRDAVDTCQRLTVTEFRFNEVMRDGLTFGGRVKKLRKALGMTQAALAKASGVAPGTIGDIEQGTQQGSKYIDLLAKALQTSAAFLRSGVDEPENQIPMATLTVRESQLIERFRNMSDTHKDRLEAFVAGIPVAKKKRNASVAQTLREIPEAKARRSG